ncbi:MAG: bestrophin family ion channel [Polyangiales bacterium]
MNASRSVTRIVNEHAALGADEKRAFAVWTVVFVHATRRSLRAEDEHPEVARLISPEEARAYTAAPHRPMFAAAQMSTRLNRYLRDGVMDPMMAQRAETEVVDLMARLGGCEHITRPRRPWASCAPPTARAGALPRDPAARADPHPRHLRRARDDDGRVPRCLLMIKPWAPSSA